MPPRQDHIPCDEHSSRIIALEKRVDDHSSSIRKAHDSLADGRVEFAELKKDIQAITKALHDLTAELKAANDAKATKFEKIEDAAIHWMVPATIVGALWVFSKTGLIPGVHP